MRRANFEKIMERLYKIEGELYKINNPPKFKIGEEVLFVGYGLQKKKITDIQLMYFENPGWFYSFGVAQDWTSEESIYRPKDV